MIKSFKITNHLGESVLLDLFKPAPSGFAITNVDGLGPVDADINTTDYAALDGAYFNSSRIGTRNIVMTIRLLENPTIEESRHSVYRYFPVKKRIRFEVETDTRKSYTYGYVESSIPTIFSNEEEVEISIICPDPFFYDTNGSIVDFSSVEAQFEFPFENVGTDPMLVLGDIVRSSQRPVLYYGEYDTGVTIRIKFSGAVTGLAIYNANTDELMRINESGISGGFQNKDELEISTIGGQKYVRLYREGVTINAINAVDISSDWPRLQPGDNLISYTADSGENNIHLIMEYSAAYGGI